MPKFIYVGVDKHIGRFGLLRRGDIIDLTDREASSEQGVGRHKDFKLYVDGKTSLPKPPRLELPPNFDSAPPEVQAQLIEQAKQRELDCQAGLNQQNARTQEINLMELKKDELEALVKKLTSEGKLVSYKKDATKREIRNAIRIALFGEANAGHRAAAEEKPGENEAPEIDEASQFPLHDQTLDEWLEAGGKREDYPPEGFAARPAKSQPQN